jgi:diguanylate cyclase (GGDEF)-like protein
MLATLDASRVAIDELRLALAKHEPPSLPRLTDHLTLEAALSARDSLPFRWLPRALDPVSRILLDASLFQPDLAYLRDRCALRGLPLALAAMDLDDLRVINSQYGEREVDRRLLPPLLRVLEALVFGRGHAYGFGRDDYAVLLPNADEAEAARLLMQFQAKLAVLDYPGLAVRPTVSIGLVVIMPDDGRTARELVAAVELAKRHAKHPGGKNCVAVLRTDGSEAVALERCSGQT